MPPDVKKMLEDYVAARDSGDPEKPASFLAKDCVVENMGGEGVHRGIAEIKAWATSDFAAFPELKLEIKSLLIAGDRVGA